MTINAWQREYIYETIDIYRKICSKMDDCKGCPIVKFCGSFNFPKDFTNEDINKIVDDICEFARRLEDG